MDSEKRKHVVPVETYEKLASAKQRLQKELDELSSEIDSLKDQNNILWEKERKMADKEMIEKSRDERVQLAVKQGRLNELYDSKIDEYEKTKSQLRKWDELFADFAAEKRPEGWSPVSPNASQNLDDDDNDWIEDDGLDMGEADEIIFQLQEDTKKRYMQAIRDEPEEEQDDDDEAVEYEPSRLMTKITAMSKGRKSRAYKTSFMAIVQEFPASSEYVPYPAKAYLQLSRVAAQWEKEHPHLPYDWTWMINNLVKEKPAEWNILFWRVFTKLLFPDIFEQMAEKFVRDNVSGKGTPKGNLTDAILKELKTDRRAAEKTQRVIWKWLIEWYNVNHNPPKLEDIANSLRFKGKPWDGWARVFINLSNKTKKGASPQTPGAVTLPSPPRSRSPDPASERIIARIAKSQEANASIQKWFNSMDMETRLQAALQEHGVETTFDFQNTVMKRLRKFLLRNFNDRLKMSLTSGQWDDSDISGVAEVTTLVGDSEKDFDIWKSFFYDVGSRTAAALRREQAKDSVITRFWLETADAASILEKIWRQQTSEGIESIPTLLKALRGFMREYWVRRKDERGEGELPSHREVAAKFQILDLPEANLQFWKLFFDEAEQRLAAMAPAPPQKMDVYTPKVRRQEARAPPPPKEKDELYPMVESPRRSRSPVPKEPEFDNDDDDELPRPMVQESAKDRRNRLRREKRARERLGKAKPREIIILSDDDDEPVVVIQKPPSEEERSRKKTSGATRVMNILAKQQSVVERMMKHLNVNKEKATILSEQLETWLADNWFVKKKRSPSAENVIEGFFVGELGELSTSKNERRWKRFLKPLDESTNKFLEAPLLEALGCAACSAPQPRSQCSACKVVRYCGQQCADAHWEEHNCRK